MESNALVASLFLLLGIPFCIVLWTLGRRGGLRFLGPAVTIPIAFYVGTFLLGETNLIESIDTYALKSPAVAASDSATPQIESPDDVDETTTDDEETDRQKALDTIAKVNALGRQVNFIGNMVMMSGILTLALLLGAMPATPELHNAPRWIVSLISASLAMVPISWTMWQLTYTPGLLGGLTPTLYSIVGWFCVGGGILGYWIAKGRAT